MAHTTEDWGVPYFVAGSFVGFCFAGGAGKYKWRGARGKRVLLRVLLDALQCLAVETMPQSKINNMHSCHAHSPLHCLDKTLYT